MSKTYVIAKGKTLTSKKGIVGEGAEVSARHFSNDDAFLILIEKGYIVEVAEVVEAKTGKKAGKKAEEIAEEKPSDAEEK